MTNTEAIIKIKNKHNHFTDHISSIKNNQEKKYRMN